MPGSPTSRKRQASKRFSPKPVFLMDFRNCFGMIASVSTFARSRGTTRPVWTVNFSMALLGGLLDHLAALLHVLAEAFHGIAAGEREGGEQDEGNGFHVG